MTPRLHLATLVDDMRRLGTQTAVVEHRGVRRLRTSYAELAQGAAWFAAELVRREIKPGERVLLWGENSAAWIACFFGCVLRGVLVVPLDATGALPFAERIGRETTPRLIVGDPVLVKTLNVIDAVAIRLDLAEIDKAMRQPGVATEPLMAEGLGPGSPLQILFTSGTTGEPKGIVHTHRNLLASLTPIEREIEKYRRYERVFHPLHFLHTLPLSHVFGQFMGLWVAPVLGAVVHYESRLEPGRLLRLLPRERISVLAAVPRVLSLLRSELLAVSPQLAEQLEAAQGIPIGKRWWRFRRVHGQLGWRFWAIVCGGATLPEALENFWTTVGIALIQGYGMTETSALVTLNHPFKPARGTLGAPLPGRELRITDSGELLVRGEMVATATWQGGELRANAAGDDGWLRTGDLTSRDQDGRLHYLGRTGQRLVTSAGLNVYLEDVEAALAGQAGMDTAVAAVAIAIEGAQGQEPGAVLRAASRELAAGAVAGANAALAPHQRVTRWWLWPGLDLPRTATGKVRRGVVEAWVGERLRDELSVSGRSAPVPSNAVGQDLLLRLIAESTGGNLQAAAQLSAIAREELSLESLGIDSLARVQVQAAIERVSGRSIEDARMSATRTLGDLRRLAGLERPSSENQVVADDGLIEPAHDADGPRTEDLSAGSSRRAGESEAALLYESRIGAGDATSDTTTEHAKREETFLYLRWPWAAPVQLLRTIFLEACVRPLVWLLAGPRVEWPGTVTDDQKPLLIVSNHVSTYDVPLILYALPPHLRRRVATAAAGEMMEAWRRARGNPLGPVIFWLLTALFNVFPLPRGHAFRRSFLHAGEALDRGFSVLVFPEGTRSHGEPMQHFRGGVGLLAQQAAARVLPVALEQARTTSKHAMRPYTATIHLGELITIEPGEEPRTITTRLEEAVRLLLEPAAR